MNIPATSPFSSVMEASATARGLVLGFTILVFGLPFFLQAEAQSRDPVHWPVHDSSRARPAVVDPGPAPPPQSPPSDAVVLFDGTSLDAWEHSDGSASSWLVREGEYFAVEPGSGAIQTKEGFGDAQLHIEWQVPESNEGDGQGRGNSGVYLMGTYEVQVLDSHDNTTYADGQAAAIYGQYPPLVNAMRPQGEWQTYDIIFRRPHFDEEGDVVAPARMTVYHNGVLVQDDVKLTGPTGHHDRPPYEQHASRLPLRLQDHGNPVRFRNVWLRELE